MSETELKLRKIAAELIKDGKVAYVIGYEKGSVSNRARPCFITAPQDAAKLVWNEHCAASLSKYLVGAKDKVGIVAKGCDGRAIVELIKDKQVDRDKVVVITPSCLGIKRATQGSTEETLAGYCERCPDRASPISDIPIEDNLGGSDAAQKSKRGIRSSKTVASWKEEFQRCTRCLACIKSCPLCYCTECELDGSMSSLVSRLRIPSELPTFHLVRAMHMAGRCVGCGACEAACPADIPLTELYSRINDEVERILGYVPGIDINTIAPVELPRPKVEKT